MEIKGHSDIKGVLEERPRVFGIESPGVKTSEEAYKLLETTGCR